MTENNFSAVLKIEEQAAKIIDQAKQAARRELTAARETEEQSLRELTTRLDRENLSLATEAEAGAATEASTLAKLTDAAVRELTVKTKAPLEDACRAVKQWL